MADDMESRDKQQSHRDNPHGCNRLFIVGASNGATKENYQEAFGKFGDIKNIYLLRDKRTGEDKGVAYITYSKASESALALEEMNGKSLEGQTRKLRIMIASDKGKQSDNDVKEEERMLRLFVVVPKSYEDKDVKEAFQEFGDIDHVKVMKDKRTMQSKGFAFVRYHRPYHAALAVEKCDPSYRARFAEARMTSQEAMDRKHGDGGFNGDGYSGYPDPRNFGAPQRGPAAFPPQGRGRMERAPQIPIMPGPQLQGPSSLIVQTNNAVVEAELSYLFDIAPGFVSCQLDRRTGVSYVKYKSPQHAHYAKTKLHGFSYPPGFNLVVDLDDGKRRGVGGIEESVQALLQTSGGDSSNLIDTILKASDMIQAAGISRKSMPGQSRSEEQPFKRSRFGDQY